MSEDDDTKKVSVSEALEALRAKRAEKSASGAAPAQPVMSQSIPPSFWLENLQDGVQKSRDRLFDSLASTASTIEGLTRRDLQAGGDIVIPDGEMQEFQADSSDFAEVKIVPRETSEGLSDISSRFGANAGLDFPRLDFSSEG